MARRRPPRRGAALLALLALLGGAAARRTLPPESASEIAGRLERAAALAADGEAGCHEDTLQSALAATKRAFLAHGQDPELCRRITPDALQVSKAVVEGQCGAGLQRLAYEMLAALVEAGGASEEEHLRRVIWLCRRAAVLRDGLHSEALGLLGTIASAKGADSKAIYAVTGAVSSMIRARDTSAEDDLGRASFFFQALGTLARFVHHVARKPRAAVRLVRAIQYIASATQGWGGQSFATRSLAVRILDSVVVPAATSAQVLTECLGVAELCVDDDGDDAAMGDAALSMLGSLAERLPERDLPRVVAVCERRAAAAARGTAAALDTVNRRLFAPDFGGESTTRLELIARSFAVQERLGTYMPCSRALDLLLGPSEAPPSHAAQRFEALYGAEPPLSPELVMYVDDFLPPSPEERARSEIVEICGRTAASVPFRARYILPAACVLPRRVGLKAVDAIAAVGAEIGGALLSGVLLPGDFVAAGACLSRSLEAAGGGQEPYLQSLREAGVRRVAARLLSVSAPVFAVWPEEERRRATWQLCALTGAVHDVCSGAKTVVA